MPFDHHSRRTNSRPSSFFAHSTMGVLLRKDRTAGATASGSALPSDATATTTSHSSLNATDRRCSLGFSSDVRYARLRPRIQPTLTGLPGPSGRTFGLTKSVSATRSSSLSSDTPVEQLQKPIFGRMNTSTFTPQSARMHTNALPLPHWSCKNGHLASVQTGSMLLEPVAPGFPAPQTPHTPPHPPPPPAPPILTPTPPP